jgi:hypothetical protein
MPNISSVFILSSWAELFLLIGRHPCLATKVEMFMIVLWNFILFFVMYCIAIIAFALSFYSLFHYSGSAIESGEGGDADDNFFRNPGMSILKTIVMMTGEFDTASIPFESSFGTSHFAFVLFIFLIPIVLYNLLIGLAVSDIQAIKNDAEVVGYIARLKLLLYIETMFQSCSLPLLHILECIFCCWPSAGKYLKSFNKRACLFADKVPDAKIVVFPNKEARISFSRHHLIYEEVEERRRRCLSVGRPSTLDSGILKRAIEIINNRRKPSEMDDVRILLKHIHEKLQEQERKFESMEKSLKETEIIVKETLSKRQLLHPTTVQRNY